MARTKARAAAEPQDEAGADPVVDTAPVEQEPATGDATPAPAGEGPDATGAAPAQDTEEGADASPSMPGTPNGPGSAGEGAPSPATIPASVEEHDEPPADGDDVGEPEGPATIPASVEEHDEPAPDAGGTDEGPTSPLIPASVEEHEGALTGDGLGEALPEAVEVREVPARSDPLPADPAPADPTASVEPEPTAGLIVEVKGPQQGRWRAERKFGPEPVVLRADELAEGELEAIKADPLLTVIEREVAPAPAPTTERTAAGLAAGLPVPGYRPQTGAAVARVTGLKHAEERVLRALDELAGDPAVDQRWLAIGRTDIERGFMAVNRSVFRPERVRLGNE